MKGRIRHMVRGAYDLQSLRIQTGNRLIANFRSKLGIDSDEEADDDASDLMDDLERQHERLTDGVAKITRRRNFDFGPLISNYTELRMVDRYQTLVEEEKNAFKDIQKSLGGVGIWKHFLGDVKGVGPAMGGVIVSEMDPFKAPYPSSFWAYAGLDVVNVWRLQGFDWEKAVTGSQPPNVELEKERGKVSKNDGSGPFDDVVYRGDGKDRTAHCYMTIDTDAGTWRLVARYDYIDKGGRSRRKEHLKTVEYEDSDGNTKTKKSLGYNPFLKKKLMGVLAPSFLRSGSDYRDFYDKYKHRKDTDPDCDWSDGHLHMASQRFMVKQFLLDCHLKWRDLKDLTVPLPYHAAKQGNTRHVSDREERLGIVDPKRPKDDPRYDASGAEEG